MNRTDQRKVVETLTDAAHQLEVGLHDRARELLGELAGLAGLPADTYQSIYLIEVAIQHGVDGDQLARRCRRIADLVRHVPAENEDTGHLELER